MVRREREARITYFSFNKDGWYHDNGGEFSLLFPTYQEAVDHWREAKLTGRRLRDTMMADLIAEDDNEE